MFMAAYENLAAPCGLYCGACIDYLVHRTCHGCGCECRKCAAAEHHEQCDIYRCCNKERNLRSCHECRELPCSKLIQFCYNPVWLHHLPVIENLRRHKTVGTEKWLKEQKDAWGNEWYLRRWLWLQKECEIRLKHALEEQKDMFSNNE